MNPAAERRVDAFLDGRVQAVQLTGHHHAGLEALLLSAAVAADFVGTVVDLGAGVGVAGMAVAARVPGAEIVLVERDSEAIAAAHASLAHPANAAFASRVRIVAVDIATPEGDRIAAGLGREFADVVITNPPFRDPGGGTMSPRAALRDAHVLEAAGLEPWIRAAASILKPGGRLVVVFRADGLSDLVALLAGRFGAIAILPVHPRADLAAGRILVRAEKGARGPERILPGLTLHGAGSTYLQPATRILRDGASLADVHPAW